MEFYNLSRVNDSVKDLSKGISACFLCMSYLQIDFDFYERIHYFKLFSKPLYWQISANQVAPEIFAINVIGHLPSVLCVMGFQ